MELEIDSLKSKLSQCQDELQKCKEELQVFRQGEFVKAHDRSDCTMRLGEEKLPLSMGIVCCVMKR